MAISPDGRWLAAGDAGGGLRLWELETPKERALAGHESGLRSVAFSPDSRHLLSCDASGLIVQWDVRTGEHEPPLRHRREDGTLRSPPRTAWSPSKARSRPTLKEAAPSYPRGRTSG